MERILKIHRWKKKEQTRQSHHNSSLLTRRKNRQQYIPKTLCFRKIECLRPRVASALSWHSLLKQAFLIRLTITKWHHLIEISSQTNNSRLLKQLHSSLQSLSSNRPWQLRKASKAKQRKSTKQRKVMNRRSCKERKPVNHNSPPSLRSVDQPPLWIQTRSPILNYQRVRKRVKRKTSKWSNCSYCSTKCSLSKSQKKTQSNSTCSKYLTHR